MPDKPYLLISDTHYHAWDAFSEVMPDGMNSRLKILIDETNRAVDHLVELGGNTVIHAGDMFHTRGSLAPSVINPVKAMWEIISKKGVYVQAIAGNHDLESNETTWLTAATSAMPITFVNEWRFDPTSRSAVMVVSWISKIAKLKEKLEELAEQPKSKAHDLVIHAPVNGVLNGIPPHGLDAEYLSSLGFRRVFAGHYHNHKELLPGIFSIGALTHQTWSDVGTKAGYCLVYPDRVDWFASHAPRFVDLPETFLEIAEGSDILEACDGNYVRATLKEPTAAAEAELRRIVKDAGAKGVLIRSPKATSEMISRRTETTAGIESVDEAVMKFADLKGGSELAALCKRIMESSAA